MDYMYIFLNVGNNRVLESKMEKGESDNEYRSDVTRSSPRKT